MAATQTDPADDRPEEPPAERRAIPGVITVLDGGVPWIRDRLELDQEWDRLTRTAATLIVDDRFDYEDQDEAGRAMFGVLACALWTTDRKDTAPMTNQDEPVTGGSIRRQLALAEQRMVSRKADWEYAMGVVAWLLWITGARDELTYPGWDDIRGV